MPRRRMIDPFFWNDRKVGTLTRDERSLVLGCLGQVDDEGRLEGNSAFLKAAVFKYDDDLGVATVSALRDSCLQKMDAWPPTHPYRLVLFQNSDEDYLFFPNFATTNKPSHATKSQLPTPPPEALPIFSGGSLESDVLPAREPPSQVSVGQSSVGKVSIGKGSAVQEDFSTHLNSEKDLTDFLTIKLKEYVPRGPTWVVELLNCLWQQALGERMDSFCLQTTMDAARTLPPETLAVVYAKVRYIGGKNKPYTYLKKVLEEKTGVVGRPRENSS